MIAGIDHVALAVPDLAAGVSACTTLFGQDCVRRDGGTAWFALGNTALRLDAADGPARIASAGFAVPSLDAAVRLLARRGVPTAGDAPFPGPDGTQRRAVRLDEAATGVALTLVEGPAPEARPGIGLDHLVIRTPNPDRAVALHAGRLGLDLRLDRSNPAWGARLIFLRCGDSIVELAHRLDEGVGTGPDGFSGLAWRAPDIAAEHARLAAAGVPLSELRPGRAEGSHVFTVREGAGMVPSIFISR